MRKSLRKPYMPPSQKAARPASVRTGMTRLESSNPAQVGAVEVRTADLDPSQSTVSFANLKAQNAAVADAAECNPPAVGIGADFTGANLQSAGHRIRLFAWRCQC